MLEITPEGHPFYIPLNMILYGNARYEVCGLTWIMSIFQMEQLL